MAKKPTGESDETRLKKKIAVRVKEEKKLSGDSAARSLRNDSSEYSVNAVRCRHERNMQRGSNRKPKLSRLLIRI